MMTPEEIASLEEKQSNQEEPIASPQENGGGDENSHNFPQPAHIPSSNRPGTPGYVFPPTHPPEVKAKARHLYSLGLTLKHISQQILVKPTTLKSWIRNYNWSRAGEGSVVSFDHSSQAVTVQPKPPENSARRLQERLSNLLSNQIAALEAKKELTVDEVRGGKGAEGLASVLKRLVDSFEGLHGEGAVTGAILSDMLSTAECSSMNVPAKVEPLPVVVEASPPALQENKA